MSQPRRRQSAQNCYWARIQAGPAACCVSPCHSGGSALADSEPGNDDLSLPKGMAHRSPLAQHAADGSAATVQKIVGEILPAHGGVAFAKEARDLLIECCVEFITLISSEANEISEKEAKKTIACDHITNALEQLGFSEYVPAVLEAAVEHKEVQKVKASPRLPPHTTAC